MGRESLNHFTLPVIRPSGFAGFVVSGGGEVVPSPRSEAVRIRTLLSGREAASYVNCATLPWPLIGTDVPVWPGERRLMLPPDGPLASLVVTIAPRLS